MNMQDAIEHIRWTIEHSPSAYGIFRADLIKLRQNIERAELEFNASQKSGETNDGHRTGA